MKKVSILFILVFFCWNLIFSQNIQKNISPIVGDTFAIVAKANGIPDDVRAEKVIMFDGSTRGDL